MKRTTISLPDELAAALAREARRMRVPVSRIARDAIAGYLGLAAGPARELTFIGIADSGGPIVPAADLEVYLEGHWADDIEADDFTGRR